jgi:homoserine kinase
MRPEPRKSFEISVPASTANVGPGFDCFGLALSSKLRLLCHIEEGEGDFRLRDIGTTPLPEHIALNSDNLVIRIADTVAKKHNRRLLNQKETLYVDIDNTIPIGKGFGSSAAAIVAGIALGAKLLDLLLTKDEMLEMAAEHEGHYDNVAAAIYGNFCIISQPISGRPHLITIPWPEELGLFAWVPDYELSTDLARKAIPEKYSRQDAIGNMSRAAGLVASLLMRNFEALHICLQDQLHQHYRASLVNQSLHYFYHSFIRSLNSKSF